MPNLTATTCFWYAEALDAGGYTIQVAAPGYQTENLPVTVSFATGCCVGGVLSPNVVVLTPGDGGP